MTSGGVTNPLVGQLGARLRAIRTASDLTLAKLGELMGRDKSWASKIENGHRLLSPEDAEMVCDVLGIGEDEREDLLTLARRAADRDWAAPGLGKPMAVLRHYEVTATEMWTCEPLIIPGLLQTRSYARATLDSLSGPEADRRATYRLGRQDVLTTGADPLRLTAYIGEYALRVPICDNDAMRAQCAHLLSMVDRDNISIRILPMVPRARGYTPDRQGSFVYFRFGDGSPDVVFVENYRGATTITNGTDVRDFHAATDKLDSHAYDEETSRAILHELAE